MLFNYLKYDLKRNLKTILSFFTVYSIVLLLTLLHFKDNVVNENTTLFTFLLAFSMLGLIIHIGLFSINNFSKELTESRGYFTFSIPISGAKIFTSKLLLVVIVFYLSQIISGIITGIVHPSLFTDIMNALSSFDLLKSVLWNIFVVNGMLFFTISAIYFSTTLVNRFIKNKFSSLINIILVVLIVTRQSDVIERLIDEKEALIPVLLLYASTVLMALISGMILDKHLELN